MFDPTMMSRVSQAIHEDRLRAAASARRREISNTGSCTASEASSTTDTGSYSRGTVNQFTPPEVARLHFHRWLVRTRLGLSRQR